MAEEVKKKAPAKPRKPRAPKAVQSVVKPENIEAEEKFEKETENLETVADNCVAEAPNPVLEIATEALNKANEIYKNQSEQASCIPVKEEEEPKVEANPNVEVELPEDSETFEEFTATLNDGVVEIKKLNPNLPDGKSKWIAQIPTKNGGAHILFKGSYPRAHRAAENWNASRGIFKDVKQIRSK